MKLQAAIGIVIAAVAFAWHFIIRVWPLLSFKNNFDPARALPMLVLFASAAICIWFWRHNHKDFAKFLSDFETYRAKTVNEGRSE
jgi:hypothetical protein